MINNKYRIMRAILWVRPCSTSPFWSIFSNNFNIISISLCCVSFEDFKSVRDFLACAWFTPILNIIDRLYCHLGTFRTLEFTVQNGILGRVFVFNNCSVTDPMWRYKEGQFQLRFNLTCFKCSRMAAADQATGASYQLLSLP